MSKALAVQQDLFIGRSIHDLPSMRDDLDLMSMPFFSTEKKPCFEAKEFERVRQGRRTYLRVSPGEYGLAKIWDKDVLIYIRTLLVDALNRGAPVSRNVAFHVHDFLRSTQRGTSGSEYEAFKDALTRLKTTSVLTNVTATDEIEDAADGFISSFRIKRRRTAKGAEVMASCEVTLSEWMYSMMIAGGRSLAIDPAYFSLAGGLERQLYGIIRKHLGEQPVWHISVENLKGLCGTRRETRKFRYDLARIVEKGLPGFRLELTRDHRPPAIAGAGEPLTKGGKREYLVARHDHNRLRPR